jgi:carbonic anhydrase
MTDPNDVLQHLLQNNRKWAEDKVKKDPDYFHNLSTVAPEFLWIGCSDSRVPANELLGIPPGKVFVHRNIANVVVHSDLNSLSVLQFAIEVLKVKHVIIVGHYGCKGVHTALTGGRVGLVDNWLRHVQDVAQKHDRYLGDALGDINKRSERLCELNVVEQVVNVCQTTIVQDAWDRGQELTVHGFVYGLKDGLLNDLKMSIASPADLAPRLDARLGAYAAASA